MKEIMHMIYEAGHDITPEGCVCVCVCERSEEHTSELQSPCNLVCRLLLEKKKIDPQLTETAHLPLPLAPRIRPHRLHDHAFLRLCPAVADPRALFAFSTGTVTLRESTDST